MNEPSKTVESPGIPLSTSLQPGDQYIIANIPMGTQSLQIITDGAHKEIEYALMLVAALNALLINIFNRLKSPIVGMNGQPVIKG